MGVTGGLADERDNRMTDSKSGSKDNLNESNMPLLEGEEKAEETPEKEVVELELEEKEEKKYESNEKKEKKEKKVKEKKVKVPKVRRSLARLASTPCPVDLTLGRGTAKESMWKLILTLTT